MSADPKLYRQMQIPFSSREEATKAANDFQSELSELRKKYRIRDLCYVMMIGYEDENGESDAILSGSFGDNSKAELLYAYALGQSSSEHKKHVEQLLKGDR